MIELLMFALAGILFGIVAGLVPGLHVNTIALMMLGLAGFFDPICLTVAVIAMAISTTFFDFIPSTLLGAPDPETALSVLPGHRMLMTGRGLEAIYLAMLGGLCATTILFLSFPLFLVLIPAFYVLVQGYIAWLLIAVAAFSILSERGLRTKLWSLAVFTLSGMLGYVVLNSYMVRDALFPLFTGLFGTGALIFSLGKTSRIPKQRLKPKSPRRKTLISGVFKGLLSGSLVGTLPAMGASQATVLTQQINKGGDKEYIISIGAINTIVALFSLISLYTISKARSGAAVVVGSLLPEFSFSNLLMMLAVALLAAGVSSLLLMRTARWFVAVLSGLDYDNVTKTVLVFLTALVLLITGIQGLFILAVSTAIGLLAPLSGVRRSTSMGVLMVPIITFYLGI